MILDKDSKRPPNKICPVCGRRSLAPEKRDNDWYFPPKKICYNCTSLEFGDYDEINANRKILIKSTKEEKAVFPLKMFDINDNTHIGNYNDFKTLRNELNMYRSHNPDSKIKIIDTKFHDFTDHILFGDK